eukprot:9190881-Pyramimonas_sp.AAC.2
MQLQLPAITGHYGHYQVRISTPLPARKSHYRPLPTITVIVGNNGLFLRARIHCIPNATAGSPILAKSRSHQIRSSPRVAGSVSQLCGTRCAHLERAFPTKIARGSTPRTKNALAVPAVMLLKLFSVTVWMCPCDVLWTTVLRTYFSANTTIGGINETHVPLHLPFSRAANHLLKL